MVEYLTKKNKGRTTSSHLKDFPRKYGKELFPGGPASRGGGQ